MTTRDAAEGRRQGAVVEVGPDSRVGDLVRWRLTTLRADLATHAEQARRGEPDGIHQARVTCRRLRAALATLRPALDRDLSDPLRGELRWLARALGDARDCEVAHARMVELLDEEPPDTMDGPMRERIDEHHRVAAGAAARQAWEALGSPRYRRLLDALDHLASTSPDRPDQDGSARDLVRLRLRAEVGRVRRRMELAGLRTRGPARDEALHAARRAAKRLRYACEVAAPVAGPESVRLASATHRLTRVLGIRQDTLVTRHALVEVARRASTAEEGEDTYGRMHRMEERRAEDAEARALQAWRDLDRPELVGWLG